MMNTSPPIFLSAVIPVYNDKRSLERAIPVSLGCLEQITPDFELIIAEDASTDDSYELACAWAVRDPRIRVFHREERLGRGSALREAVIAASGDIFCYFDVDLATDMAYLPALIMSIRSGHDIATGSRLLQESTVTRSRGRELKSRAYNLLVRLFLGGRIRDHQCGFKAFNRERLLVLLSDVRDTHWFWDTELLAYAERRGYHIEEIPVTWREGTGTTVRNGDIFRMGRSIVSLWFRFLQESYHPGRSRNTTPESPGSLSRPAGHMNGK